MTGRALSFVVVITVALFVLLAVTAQHFALPVEILQPIYTPTFEPVHFTSPGEALNAAIQHFHRLAGHRQLARLLPGQGGALWLSLLLVLAVAVDWSKASARRTIDLLLAQSVGWALFGLLDYFRETTEPAYLTYVRGWFAIAVACTGLLAVRAAYGAVRPYPGEWRSNLRFAPLATTAALMVALNLVTIFGQPSDDSSYFANLGGQRLRERLMLPYGDPLLTGTAGAAYAPLMYLAHAATQAGLGEPLNSDTSDLPHLGPAGNYREPDPLVTQIDLGLFQLAAAAALAVIGWQLQGETLAAALVALYCGSSYVLGVGGARESLTGLTFVSHIMPTAATLVAFAMINRAAWSGATLAIAAGFGFYPVFFVPVWLGWQWGRSRGSAARFVGAFAVTAGVIGLWVITSSRAAPHMTLVGTIVRDTLGHHTDPTGYGMSPFGLWGQSAGILHWFIAPLSGSFPVTAPFFLGFIACLVWMSAVARRSTVPSLALLTAVAAMLANVWKIHATASYVAWFYPFLIIGLLGEGAVKSPAKETAHGSSR